MVSFAASCEFLRVAFKSALIRDNSCYSWTNKLTRVYPCASDIRDGRFVPYLSVHEFEALLFSDPNMLKRVYFDNNKQIDGLVALSEEVNPELINDDPETCPSSRIKKAIHSYNKRFAGSRVAKAIGLNKIRSRCKHFDEWIGKLERLANESS